MISEKLREQLRQYVFQKNSPGRDIFSVILLIILGYVIVILAFSL